MESNLCLDSKNNYSQLDSEIDEGAAVSRFIFDELVIIRGEALRCCCLSLSEDDGVSCPHCHQAKRQGPQLRMIARVLRKQQQSLDELSAEFYDSMAERLVDAAFDGDIRAIQEIARAMDG